MAVILFVHLFRVRMIEPWIHKSSRVVFVNLASDSGYHVYVIGRLTPFNRSPLLTFLVTVCVYVLWMMAAWLKAFIQNPDSLLNVFQLIATTPFVWLASVNGEIRHTQKTKLSGNIKFHRCREYIFFRFKGFII